MLNLFCRIDLFQDEVSQLLIIFDKVFPKNISVKTVEFQLDDNRLKSSTKYQNIPITYLPIVQEKLLKSIISNIVVKL
jgi:hypothetical protein